MLLLLIHNNEPIVQQYELTILDMLSSCQFPAAIPQYILESMYYDTKQCQNLHFAYQSGSCKIEVNQYQQFPNPDDRSQFKQPENIVTL